MKFAGLSELGRYALEMSFGGLCFVGVVIGVRYSFAATTESQQSWVHSWLVKTVRTGFSRSAI